MLEVLDILAAGGELELRLAASCFALGMLRIGLDGFHVGWGDA